MSNNLIGDSKIAMEPIITTGKNGEQLIKLPSICPRIHGIQTSNEVKRILGLYPARMLVDFNTKDGALGDALEILKNFSQTAVCFEHGGNKFQEPIIIDISGINIGLGTIDILGDERLTNLSAFIGSGVIAYIHLPNGILVVNFIYNKDNYFTAKALRFESDCVRSKRKNLRARANNEKTIMSFIKSKLSLKDRVEQFVLTNGLTNDPKVNAKMLASDKLMPIMNGGMSEFDNDFIGIISDISYNGIGFYILDKPSFVKNDFIMKVKLPFLLGKILELRVVKVLKYGPAHKIGCEIIYKEGNQDQLKDDISKYVNAIDMLLRDELQKFKEQARSRI